MKSDFLEKILIQKKQLVERLITETHQNQQHPLNRILELHHPSNLLFSKALRHHSLSVIGEIKRRSPSVQEIGSIPDPSSLASEYCQAGISAISVLTDTPNFGGSLDDLKQVAAYTKAHYPFVPVLRKDFIIHPIQLAEAVLAGAHAALIIVAAVGRDLKSLLKVAKKLGIEILTEVHDREELDIALEEEAEIIGVNHRNLKTFQIDLNLSEKLRPLIPSNVITVAESGIHDAHQAKRIREYGYDAILIGEALVRSNNRFDFIRQMRGDATCT